ncbi:MAG: hypothetical protein ACI9EF_003661, partial [Pseudohongiellaceae bacterium]
RLVVSPAGLETVQAGDQRELIVDRTAVRGALDRAEAAHDVLRLSGWAIDLEDGSPADNLLVFLDGECVFSGRTGHERADAGQVSGTAGSSQSGFELELPLSLVGDLTSAPLRLFATSGDKTAELTYADDAAWVALVQHHLDDDGVLVGTDGSRRVPQVGPLDGVLDTAEIAGGRLNLLGWAADLAASRNAEKLVVLADGLQVYAGRVWLDRPSLADDLGDPALYHAGFHHKLPLEWFGAAPHGRVQVFAVSGDHAVELRPTSGARWVTPQAPIDQLLLDPREHSGVLWTLTAASSQTDEPPSDNAGETPSDTAGQAAGDHGSELTGARLVGSQGVDAEVRPFSLAGALDAVVDDGDTLRLLGWAVDSEQGRPADHVVVLLDGEPLVAATPWLERQDVALSLENPALASCGFQLVLPREALLGDLRGRLGVLAISGSAAMALPLGAGARWLEQGAPATGDSESSHEPSSTPTPAPASSSQDDPPAPAGDALDALPTAGTLTLTPDGLRSASGQLWSFSSQSSPGPSASGVDLGGDISGDISDEIGGEFGGEFGGDISEEIDGAIDSAILQNETLELHGWAANHRELRPATAVVLVVDGLVTHVITPAIERLDLISAFDAPLLGTAGFSFDLPVQGDFSGRIAVYALVGHRARRLRTSAAAAWISAPASPQSSPPPTPQHITESAETDSPSSRDS